MLRSMGVLDLDHCHHCGVDEPTMLLDSIFVTNNHRLDALREWCIYHCEACGGAILTGSIAGSRVISEIYPSAIDASDRCTRNEDIKAQLPASNKHDHLTRDEETESVCALH